MAVDDCDALSVALTVKLDVPAAVGVPLILPVLAFIDKPAGSAPADTLHVKDVPIVGGTAESAAEYGDWTSPWGSVVVVITGERRSSMPFELDPSWRCPWPEL